MSGLALTPDPSPKLGRGVGGEGHPGNSASRAEALHRFNRFYTRQVGVLTDGLLESDFRFRKRGLVGDKLRLLLALTLVRSGRCQ